VSDDTVAVDFLIVGRWTVRGEARMSREKYEALGQRIDDRPRGFDRTKLADDVMEALGVDVRDGEIDDFEVDEFYAETQP
jgi:hypothetical protein